MVPTEKQPTAMSERVPSSTLAVSSRARADAEDADASQRFSKLGAVESLGVALDVGVACVPQRIDSRLRDTLKEQNFDFLLGAGKGLAHVMLPIRC